MTQQDLEREVARTTGETVSTIRNLGFSLIETPEPEPQTVDWGLVPTPQVAAALPHCVAVALDLIERWRSDETRVAPVTDAVHAH